MNYADWDYSTAEGTVPVALLAVRIRLKSVEFLFPPTISHKMSGCMRMRVPNCEVVLNSLRRSQRHHSAEGKFRSINEMEYVSSSPFFVSQIRVAQKMGVCAWKRRRRRRRRTHTIGRSNQGEGTPITLCVCAYVRIVRNYTKLVMGTIGAIV